MKPISLQNALTRMIGTLDPSEFDVSEEELKKKFSTTIRLEPQVRKFIEYYSKTLGVSLQDFVAMTMKAVMVSTFKPDKSKEELRKERFFDIFKKHNISACDIPSCLGGNKIRKSDLLNSWNIDDLIDQDVIRTISDLFNVNPLWLEGFQDQSVIEPQNLCLDLTAARQPSPLFKRMYDLLEQGKKVSLLVLVEDGSFGTDSHDQYRGKHVIPFFQIQHQDKHPSFVSYQNFKMINLNNKEERLQFKSLVKLLDKMEILIEAKSISGNFSEMSSSLFVEHHRKISDLDFNFKHYIAEDKEANIDAQDFKEVQLIYEERNYRNYEDVFKNGHKYKGLDIAWQEEILNRSERG